jgi:hypothetical protein
MYHHPEDAKDANYYEISRAPILCQPMIPKNASNLPKFPKQGLLVPYSMSTTTRLTIHPQYYSIFESKTERNASRITEAKNLQSGNV